jgi:uncharacterized metal-binding protein YceD (DUF177 family)
VTAEFSRPIALDGVPAGGVSMTLEASAAECAALAARFDLVRLDGLTAELRIAPIGDGTLLRVAGELQAALATRCVVTLDPVEQRIAAGFERLFSRVLPAVAEGEVEVEVGEELPEPLPGPTLDLGELVAEELALALDPYPRSPAADAALAELAAEGEGRTSPFAVLAALRQPSRQRH